MDLSAETLEDRPAAHKRPGVISLIFAYRLIAALLLAWPFAVIVGRAVGAYPTGDAVLFEPGSMMLIEVVRRTREAMPPAFGSALLASLVLAFLGLLPLAALISALGTKGRVRARDLGAWALRPFGTFALLLGVASVVQAILAAIIFGIGGSIARRSSFDAREGDRVRIIVAIVALLVVLLIGVFHDLARVASARGELGVRGSIRVAFTTLRRSPGSIFVAWGSRAALGAIALAASIVIGSRVGLERGGQVALGFLVHQGAIFAALFLRASWLAFAVSHVDLALAPRASAEEAPAAEPAAIEDEAEAAEVPAPAPLLAVEGLALAVPPEENPAIAEPAAPLGPSSVRPSDRQDEKVEREEGMDA